MHILTQNFRADSQRNNITSQIVYSIFSQSALLLKNPLEDGVK